MANIDLAVQAINRDGVTPTWVTGLSTGNVYRVLNNGRTIIAFRKTGAGACQVTFQTPAQSDGLAVAEFLPAATIPATTGEKIYSKLSTQTFNVAGQGYLEFTLSEITGLSVACYQVEE